VAHWAEQLAVLAKISAKSAIGFKANKDKHEKLFCNFTPGGIDHSLWHYQRRLSKTS
jgi:hypothetical protein